jgi:hypothetical protein
MADRPTPPRKSDRNPTLRPHGVNHTPCGGRQRSGRPTVLVRRPRCTRGTRRDGGYAGHRHSLVAGRPHTRSGCERCLRARNGAVRVFWARHRHRDRVRRPTASALVAGSLQRPCLQRRPGLGRGPSYNGFDAACVRQQPGRRRCPRRRPSFRVACHPGHPGARVAVCRTRPRPSRSWSRGVRGTLRHVPRRRL